MSKVESLFPANDFKVVADNASKEIIMGICMGYDKDGSFVAFAGGVNKDMPVAHQAPTVKDWNFMVDIFKINLITGNYG